MQILLPFWWPWIKCYNINTKRLTNPELITLVRDSSASHCCGWKRTDLEFFRYAPPIFPINCFGISCIISFWGHESAFLEICNKLYSVYWISKQKVQLLIILGHSVTGRCNDTVTSTWEQNKKTTEKKFTGFLPRQGIRLNVRSD